MKKLLLLASLTLILTGCSNSTKITSKISDGSTTIATTNNSISITKQQIYESLLSTYGANKVIDKSLQAIADAEITDTSSIDQKVNDTISSYSNMLGGESGLLSYVQSSGYDSIDAYKEEVLIPNAKQTLLIQKYIDDNFSTLADTYGYSYIQYFTVSTESDALSIINSIDNGESTFDDEATKANGSVPDQVLSYTKASSSTLDSSIAAIAKQFTTVGMYSVPVSLSDGTYAVINVKDVDRDSHKDEIEKSLLSISDVTSEGEAYYLNKYNFEVYEKGIVEDIKNINENYIK